MIHFKNHNAGLSFIEVIVALLMVSLVILASFNTQSIMLRSTIKAVNQLRVVIAIKNFFAESQLKGFLETDRKQEQALDMPAAQLEYQGGPVKNSSGLKNITGMSVEKITAVWQEFGIEKTLHMSQFVYKKPEEPKA